ncbi:alpha/beta fold hydrolase [Aquabacter cavernae]|uniref:alpha/beta fold hydrolase n=1 Tax=Aquabacter cavernae TaxID=2496029 RepID=UPI000F8E08AB|nr:alpha/beta hydrolase [Aquabacter cavernae]
MPQVRANGVNLAYREWGEGDTTLLFIHGNLASKEWISLAAPHFPRGVRTIAIDWRGCGDSERPVPTADFANYSIATHAADMLAALDALGVSFCHLATHSTGGIISTRMLLAQPERFGRVFALSPVSPRSIPFTQAQLDMFLQMKANPAFARMVMAMTAPSLFVSTAPGQPPKFRPDAGARADLFERILAQTMSVSDGIWLGTPIGLTREFESGELFARMGDIRHPHLIAWGEYDGIIAKADLELMVKGLPDCRLSVVPDVGHSLNLEDPELYAGYLGGWLSGNAV